MNPCRKFGARLALGFIAVTIPLTALAACEASSGEKSVPLVELYTSEGCNSCPPADRWLSDLLRSAPPVVALSFHVDYWNDLGWRDRFSSPDFTLRQYRRIDAQGGGTAYTPQIMVNGRVWRKWLSRFPEARDLEQAGGQPAQARLKLALTPADEASWTVELSGRVEAPTTGLDAYLAVYEDGLTTTVRAGENRGRTLHHDRVVRKLFGPFALDANGSLQTRTKIERVRFESGRHGIAAFIQRRNGAEVLQALAMPFCPVSGT
jgi:hypothetical protein